MAFTSPTLLDSAKWRRLTQLGWLAQVLSMENRPGMMLITGDGGSNLLSGEMFS